jgi:ElaB/YqjD/DUF883 family membrane-anchored ribosome-binding protein
MTVEMSRDQRTLLAEINTVLSDRTDAAINDSRTLRDAVCGYVDAERARGSTLKSIIQTVKEILKDAEDAAAGTAYAADRPDNRLAGQLVDWCMEFHRKAGLARAANPRSFGIPPR